MKKQNFVVKIYRLEYYLYLINNKVSKIKRNTTMTKSKKMLATIIVLVIMFVSVTGALVAVLVANTQSAKSNVHVKYTSTDVNVRVEAKYYVGTTGTDLMNGTSTYIDLGPTSEIGSLNQVANEVLLDKNNDKIIYEYKFTNLSDKIPATIRQTVNADNTLMIPTDTYNNVGITYTSSSTSLGSEATSDMTTLNAQGLPINTTRYVYVIVSITDLLKNVAFNGNFGWTLEKGEAITTNASSGSQSIVVDTTDGKLYNKSAMENLQLVVGVENTEPEYPVIEGKCFVGWYTDSNYETKVEFPFSPSASDILYPKHLTATTDVDYVYNTNTETYAAGGDWIQYSGSSTTIVIADIYDDGQNGKALVTGMMCGYGMAYFKNDLENIYLPYSLTDLGDYTFYGCTNLTNINIPHNVKRIGTSAFNSSGITSIVIGAQLKRIEHLAFTGCDNLQSVTFEVCFGWTVTDKENSTTGDAVTISATDFAANATLLKTTHVSKYWNRA